MPLLEFQQPQQYVEDNIFYDFHKSFKVWHFAWNDHGWGQDLKKNKIQTSTGCRKKTNTRACDWWMKETLRN